MSKQVFSKLHKDFKTRLRMPFHCEHHEVEIQEENNTLLMQEHNDNKCDKLREDLHVYFFFSLCLLWKNSLDRSYTMWFIIINREVCSDSRPFVPWRNKAAGYGRREVQCYPVKAIKTEPDCLHTNYQRWRAQGNIPELITKEGVYCTYTVYITVSYSLAAVLCTLGGFSGSLLIWKLVVMP